MIDRFLASIRKSNRSSPDHVQSELVTAILEVVFVADKLHWRGDKAANANRAERQVGEVDTWAASPMIYHVQSEIQPRKLLAECGEPRALAASRSTIGKSEMMLASRPPASRPL